MTDSGEMVMVIRDLLRSELRSFATQILEVEMLNLQSRLQQGLRSDFQGMFVDLQSELELLGLCSAKTSIPARTDLRSTATGPKSNDFLNEEAIPTSDGSMLVEFHQPHAGLLGAKTFTPSSMEFSSTANGTKTPRESLTVKMIPAPEKPGDEMRESNFDNYDSGLNTAHSCMQRLPTFDAPAPEMTPPPPDINRPEPPTGSPNSLLSSRGMRVGSKGRLSVATQLTSHTPVQTTAVALFGPVASEDTTDSANAMAFNTSGSAGSTAEGAWIEKHGSEGDLNALPSSPCSRKLVSSKRRTSLKKIDRSLSLALASKQSLRVRVLKVVNKPVFDYVVAGLILANGILVGVQTDYLARETLEDPPVFFQMMEIVFCILFTAELGLRLFAFRCSFFTMLQRGWNIFDFSIVSLQLLEMFMSLMAGGVGVSFNVLRILRLMRIVRLARALRLIGELRTIVSSIAGSVKPLLWTGVLLFMIAYVVGVALTQLVHAEVLALIERGESVPHDLDRHWGNLFASILTLIQSITGGLDWDAACQPLMEIVGVAVAFLFLVYILFSSLALLNVVTGVFIDSVMDHGKRNKQQALQQHVQTLFTALDVNPDGEIHWEDFERQLEKQEMKEFFSIVDVDISNARNLFELLDSNGSGSVDTSELMDGCLRFWTPATNVDLRMISQDIGRLRQRTRELISLVKSLQQASCCNDSGHLNSNDNDASRLSDESDLMCHY